MKMKEAEARTGLDRKNIRYYESEELLSPERQEGSRYRDYSEDDIKRLLEIKLFRQLGISIKDIRSYIEGTFSLEQMMLQRRSQIDLEMEQLKTVGQLCARLADKHRLSLTDVDDYLSEIREEEKKGIIFQNIKRDWTMYKEELHKEFIYVEPEGEMLNPGDFAVEASVYAAKNHLSYETVRLDKNYAVVRLDGIAYQASYTCIRMSYAHMPMLKLTRCNPPDAPLSTGKYILFSILPPLLIFAGIAGGILCNIYLPDYPRLAPVFPVVCFLAALFVFAGARNVHYNQ